MLTLQINSNCELKLAECQKMCTNVIFRFVVDFFTHFHLETQLHKYRTVVCISLGIMLVLWHN